MSDTPDTNVDLSKLSEAELRAKYAEMTDAIETLRAEQMTVETGQAIRALKIKRNEIVATVRELHAAQADDIEDVDIDAVDASATIVEALAADGETVDPAAETTETETTEVSTAPAAETTEVVETEGTETAPAAEVETPEVTENAETAPAAEATATVAETAEPGRETATTHDVPTTNHGGTPVADSTPDNTSEPTTDETAAVIEAAQQIADSAALAGAGAVTASLHDQRPVVAGLSDRPSVDYQAGAGQTNFSQGTPLDFEQIGQAISNVQSTGRAEGSGIVASLPGFDVTQGMLHSVLSSRTMTADEATAAINETVKAHGVRRTLIIEGRLDDIDPVTAAICTPLDIIRDVPECGVTDMPFSDIFPQRGIGRLGFQYFPQMALIDTDPNVNIWSDSDQDAVDESDTSTWKPSPLIQCLPAVQVTAEELVASAQVDNSTQISQPEQVVQFMHKLAVQRARRREQYLQGKFDATASGYTLTGDYGAMVALLSTGELLERLVYGERLDEGDYDLVLEPGHMRKLLLDEDARVFGDTLASRKAGVIAKIKDELGVGQVIVLRDFRTGGGYDDLNAPGDAAVAMPRLYDSNRVRFVPASAYIFGATGEDATGWETDPQLTRQNRMQWFSKEWLLLAKHGCHPAAYIDLTSCASGARANGIEPVDCTDQAS